MSLINSPRSRSDSTNSISSNIGCRDSNEYQELSINNSLSITLRKEVIDTFENNRELYMKDCPDIVRNWTRIRCLFESIGLYIKNKDIPESLKNEFERHFVRMLPKKRDLYLLDEVQTQKLRDCLELANIIAEHIVDDDEIPTLNTWAKVSRVVGRFNIFASRSRTSKVDDAIVANNNNVSSFKDVLGLIDEILPNKSEQDQMLLNAKNEEPKDGISAFPEGCRFFSPDNLPNVLLKDDNENADPNAGLLSMQDSRATDNGQKLSKWNWTAIGENMLYGAIYITIGAAIITISAVALPHLGIGISTTGGAVLGGCADVAIGVGYGAYKYGKSKSSSTNPAGENQPTNNEDQGSLLAKELFQATNNLVNLKDDSNIFNKRDKYQEQMKKFIGYVYGSNNSEERIHRLNVVKTALKPEQLNTIIPLHIRFVDNNQYPGLLDLKDIELCLYRLEDSYNVSSVEKSRKYNWGYFLNRIDEVKMDQFYEELADIAEEHYTELYNLIFVNKSNEFEQDLIQKESNIINSVLSEILQKYSCFIPAEEQQEFIKEYLYGYMGNELKRKGANDFIVNNRNLIEGFYDEKIQKHENLLRNSEQDKKNNLTGKYDEEIQQLENEIQENKKKQAELDLKMRTIKWELKAIKDNFTEDLKKYLEPFVNQVSFDGLITQGGMVNGEEYADPVKAFEKKILLQRRNLNYQHSVLGEQIKELETQKVEILKKIADLKLDLEEDIEKIKEDIQKDVEQFEKEMNKEKQRRLEIYALMLNEVAEDDNLRSHSSSLSDDLFNDMESNNNSIDEESWRDDDVYYALKEK